MSNKDERFFEVVREFREVFYAEMDRQRDSLIGSESHEETKALLAIARALQAFKDRVEDEVFCPHRDSIRAERQTEAA